MIYFFLNMFFMFYFSTLKLLKNTYKINLIIFKIKNNLKNTLENITTPKT